MRKAEAVYTPIAQMKSAQQGFEAWSKQQAWQEPSEPTLSLAQVDRFLALRTELQRLEEDAPRPRHGGREQPSFEDVPKIVTGVSGFVSARLLAFQRAGMTTAEYRYLDRLIYGRWLRGLRAAGQDPAVLERAAQEILNTARDESDAGTAARLRRAAERLRQRRPSPPAGLPEEVHALLSSRATEIEALSDTSPSRIVPDGG